MHGGMAELDFVVAQTGTLVAEDQCNLSALIG